MASRGLVIGKFYPPHAGHHYLINTALSQVDHLDVLICYRDDQVPPAELRAAWLREVHPAATVRLVEDTLADDDSPGWAEFTRRFLGYSPDVVFTSEDYGDPYAHFLGARHVQVDKARISVPCSGTAVRADPLAQWGFLEPCVRAYYIPRIAVFGAESSGTTTLTQALAAHYHTNWVPEYGRNYAEAKMQGPDADTWRSEEFTHIAARQCEWEDAAAREANKLLFCDTPAFATSLWHERYLGRLSPEVEALAAPYRYALSFLTNVDIPFVQDGTRDGEHIRHAMHDRIVAWLNTHNQPFTLLSGSLEERLQTAIDQIDSFLGGTTLPASEH